jgi:hypothetical protein
VQVLIQKLMYSCRVSRTTDDMFLTPDDLPTDVEALQRRVLALAAERQQLLKELRVLHAFMTFEPTSAAPIDPVSEDP